MSGFVYNTRRGVFNDIKTRRALAMAFDFDWENKTIANGAYKRTDSYFSNSELSASGMPPKFDLREAGRQLTAAGWRPGSDGVRRKNGQRLEFEILLTSPAIERWAVPFASNLKKVGAKVSIRKVDTATYQTRLNNFDFDMIFETLPQSNSPGNEQIDFWASTKLNVNGSRNYAGVNSQKVDSIVDAIIKATSRMDLIIQCQKLDRLLMSEIYVIPGWYLNYWRLAWWPHSVQKPDVLSPLTPAISDTWWSVKN